MMNGTVKKLLAGVMSLVLAAGVGEASSVDTYAAANPAARVPVSFAMTNWEEEPDKNASATFDCDLGKGVTLGENCTLSYEVYIPQQILVRYDSAFLASCWISLRNIENDDYIGDLGATMELQMVKNGGKFDFQRWDEAKQDTVAADEYASCKKSGDYYVLSVKNVPLHSEIENLDLTKTYDVYAGIVMTGVNAKSKQFVYVDNIVLKAGGSVVAEQNFSELGSEGARYYHNGEKDNQKQAIVENFSNKILKVSKNSLTIRKGKKASIKATAAPAAKVTYKTSDKKVATVTSKGVVKGVKKGKATITVTANGVSKKVKVTVK